MRAGVATARQVQGKQLSYNNINDTDAAYECVAEFDPKRTAAVAIIKHANPCGVAEGANLVEAYRKALACDLDLGVRRHRRAQPHARRRGGARHHRDFHRGDHRAGRDRGGDRDRRARRRTCGCCWPAACPIRAPIGLTVKSVAGGLLVQSRDNATVDEMQLKTVTKRAPTAAELDDLRFAFRVAKHVKSNTIVYAKDRATVGIGAGQMSRVDAARIAARKAEDAAKRAEARRAADQGLGGRLRRVLPVRRRPAGRDRGRRHRGDPARRLGATTTR